MNKLKNWLLPTILALLGSIDLFFGLFSTLAEQAGWPKHYITVFQIVAFVVSIVITKKQPPSLKKAKHLAHRGIDVKKSE